MGPFAELKNREPTGPTAHVIPSQQEQQMFLQVISVPKKIIGSLPFQKVVSYFVRWRSKKLELHTVDHCQQLPITGSFKAPQLHLLPGGAEEHRHTFLEMGESCRMRMDSHNWNWLLVMVVWNGWSVRILIGRWLSSTMVNDN